MKSFEVSNKINNAINYEAKRILNELMQLYKNKIEVNKSFNILVEERVNKKYNLYKNTILFKVTKFIPLDLYVCPNGKWVFVSEEEFNSMINEDRNISKIKNKKILELLSKKMCQRVLLLYRENKLYNVDIFDILEEITSEQPIKQFDDEDCEYLIKVTIDKIEKDRLKVIDIFPIKIGTI
ncbi:MAG TPA: hypothetical protein PLV83_01490 [Bacilli bacterium]|nr:hypothetical protein [Bacilli bacterium]